MTQSNSDPKEIEKFGALAHLWWDTESEFRPLHDINPSRLGWIADQVDLDGKRVLDIGCGGGILAESLAKKGGMVTGIDLSEQALSVAKLHRFESGLERIDYRAISAESLALEESRFEVITCMEMLEHVPDPESTLRASANLLTSGGHLFLSTINRNFKAYLFAIVGAERVLKLLPQGTHDIRKFLKPSELAGMALRAGLSVENIVGMHYNPFSRNCSLTRDTSINYLMHLRKIE